MKGWLAALILSSGSPKTVYGLKREAQKIQGAPGHPPGASLTEKFLGPSGVRGTQKHLFPDDVWSFLTFLFFQFG